MGIKQSIYKDGILIYQSDDRVIDEERDILQLMIRQEASELLSKTDWMAIRALDGVPMPDSVAEYRKAVRAASNRMCEAIDAAKSLDELDSMPKTIANEVKMV